MFELETEPLLTAKRLHTFVRWFARGLGQVAPNEMTAVAEFPVGTFAAMSAAAAAAASVVEPVVAVGAFGVAVSVVAKVSAAVFSALVVVVLVAGGDSRIPVATPAAVVSLADFVGRVLIVVKIVARGCVAAESAVDDAVVPVMKPTAETIAVHLLGEGLLREW